MNSYKLSVSNYGIETWVEQFPDWRVSVDKLKIHHSWKPFTATPEYAKQIKDVNEYLSYCLQSTGGTVKIYPYPSLVFNAFNCTPLDQVKVVILGQDPYINAEEDVPQAMGLSFSVPTGVTIPPSLNNIYNNLVKYGHMDTKPNHGNLSFWAYQGCLLVNTAFTVQAKCSNSHEKHWQELTDTLIRYLSQEKEGIVFALWGSPAIKKLALIDQTKHGVTISSHPSPLSCNKPVQSYGSFAETDHFGQINKYLTKVKKSTIMWKII